MIAAGDVDGDGILDVVTGDLDTANVRWTRQTAQGEFESTLLVGRMADIGEVATADLNGDDRADVLVSSPSMSGVFWYPGSASGPGPQRPVMSGLSQVDVLAVADLDMDGDNDVVAAGSTSAAWVANQSSNFGGQQTLPGAPGGLFDLRALDLNGDAQPDVIGCEPTGVGWFANQGGTFAEWTPLVDAPVTGLAASDLDSDGDIDLLVAANGVWLHRGLGEGRFTSGRLLPGSNTSTRLHLSDLDGDGLDDLVGADPDGLLLAWRNLGDAALSGPIELGQADLVDVNSADLDADGASELLVPFPSTDRAEVWVVGP